jgi:undecaprenyl-diphosphatase
VATLIEVFILAVVQGLTEWLPVSSSGHLVITQKLLGLELPLIYSVMMHVGTLIVILIVFRKDITDILKALAKRDLQTPEGRLALYIVLGSVPIALVGFFFRDAIESLFSNLTAVGAALIITGTILAVSEKRKGNRQLGTLDSILIGIAQAVAIVPGISRSGATVSTGLLRKIDKQTAFRYSFLLSVPAILGATLVEAKDLATGNIDLIPLFIGVIVAMTVGYVSLKLLQEIVMKEKLHLFATYCLTVGIAILVYTILQ